MPTFPAYHGELPIPLNPRNLRHYFLLAYWVYFRPTALKCYLYQADPDLYRAGPGRSIFRTLRVPAYRSLYLMGPGIVLLLSVVAGLPIVLTTNWIQGTQVDWLGWTRSITFSVAFSIVVCMIVSILFSTISGVATGIAFGVLLGIVGGAVLGISLGVALGVTSGLALVPAMIVVFGITIGIACRVVLGVTGGIALGVMSGAALTIISIIVSLVIFGVAFGITSDDIAAFNLVAISIMLTVLGTMISIGTLRVLSYPFQIIVALWATFQGDIHPLEWDELSVLPLLWTQRALSMRLLQNELDGLQFVANVARNPFHRWVAQRTLYNHLHDHTTPLHFLYSILVCHSLQEHIFVPLDKQDWEQQPTVIRLLLGELDSHWVDCSNAWPYRLAERLIWVLTWLLRYRSETLITSFAGILYELLNEQTITEKNFHLSTYADTYTSLIGYPGGEEIARTFETMAAFLAYDDISALPAAAEARNQVFSEKPGFSSAPIPIRPSVLTALSRLGQVSAEVAAYQDATSRVSQLAALARATDELDTLDEYVVAEVMAPEQTILRRIIRQWRRLVSEAGGEVGRAEEIGPVANPYVAGNPVTGHLFAGREDILRRLEELWGGAGQKPSVVLYGHRRMGKSSILHNLGARFGTQTVIVDFNMQRVGLVTNTGELLYNLALALYDAQTQTSKVWETLEVLTEPNETQFTAHNPYTTFDRFLKRLDRARDEHRFIVTVDEFELIEQLIAESKLEPRLLDFWRGLIQTYPWFVMAFAGLHTLQEMTRDYWHPLYGSVTGIPVSFLDHDAAWRLITQPTPEFSLDYDRDAVERIIALTHGQPYLVQLAGHGLVTRFNRQTFEQERRFGLDDVEAIINAPEFYRDGDAYFTGVWRQAETSDPPEQTAVLRALAQSEAGMPDEEIARQAELAPENVKDALETLKRHDMVMEIEGHWQFTVELMRRWVRNRREKGGTQ